MAGRPKNKFKTIAKTYSYYEEDIKEMVEMRVTPKELLRLGIEAKKQGWNPSGEIQEVGDLKKRLKSMSYTLQLYVEKFNKLALLVEKKLEVDLNEDVYTNDKLDRLLEEIEE